MFNHALEGIIGYEAQVMIIKYIDINNEEFKNNLMRKINIWNQLHHENIFPLIKYHPENG